MVKTVTALARGGQRPMIARCSQLSSAAARRARDDLGLRLGAALARLRTGATDSLVTAVRREETRHETLRVARVRPPDGCAPARGGRRGGRVSRISVR
jgi:hypothetical protein